MPRNSKPIGAMQWNPIFKKQISNQKKKQNTNTTLKLRMFLMQRNLAEFIPVLASLKHSRADGRIKHFKLVFVTTD